MVRPHRTLLTRVRAHLESPLPAPAEWLRRGPLREGAFPSALRSTRLTSQLGLMLGIAFGVCFVTGLISHFIQHPGTWFWWPAGPVWLYRVTQGVHVATGLATVPLLGAKLWSVYPKLFTWPPARSLVHAAERGSIALLVAAALFQITTGVFNVARWYAPIGLFFTTAHYWTAWIAIGALLIHIEVRLPVIRRALQRSPTVTPDWEGTDSPPAARAAAPTDTPERADAESRQHAGLSRRGLLAVVAASAGVITVATVGQTIRPFSAVSVLAPRRPGQGPQGFPVNKSAQSAGMLGVATDPAYRLMLIGPAGTRALALADLTAMDQHTANLPIACVEGWSQSADWTGVRIRDLADLAGVPGDATVTVESLQKGSRYGTSMLPPNFVQNPLTLLALRLHGEPLALDHGYPARLIAPNRPGVLQTKWVGILRVEAV